MSSIGDWISVVKQVADVASNVFTLFGGPDEEDQIGYVTGDVHWLWSTQDQAIVAKNPTDRDNALVFTLTSQDAATSVYQPLSAQTEVVISPEVFQFQEGQLSVARTLDSTSADPNSKLVSFVVSALGIALVVSIIKGVTVSVQRTVNGYSLSIKTDAVQLSSVTATATDESGNSVSARADFTRNRLADENDFEIPFPPDFAPKTPYISLLNVSLTLPSDSLDKATEERRARLQPIRRITKGRIAQA